MTKCGSRGVSLGELSQRYPRLYHMAEKDSLGSILTHGLLSTSSLLDLHGVCRREREQIENYRLRSCKIESGFGRAVVRDQAAMNIAKLGGCLQDGLTPRDWFRLLNERVFFWVSEARLFKLLNAQSYRSNEHDVLVLRTRTVVEQYERAIDLCPINSGATGRIAQSRGQETFLPIIEYPWQDWLIKRGRTRDVVVELTVREGLRNIRDHIEGAWRMKGSEYLHRLEIEGG
jgi:hypothetical protein